MLALAGTSALPTSAWPVKMPMGWSMTLLGR
jgi:hypothetical protein